VTLLAAVTSKVVTPVPAAKVEAGENEAVKPVGAPVTPSVRLVAKFPVGFTHVSLRLVA
jgi:hypothetical protein